MAYNLPVSKPASCLNQGTRLRRTGGGEGSETKLTLDELLGNIREIPPLSPVVLHVLPMTSRENIAGRDLAQAIGRDLRYAARFLKLANSAVFALPRPVKTPMEAVMLLGNEKIRQIALIAALHDLMAAPLPGYELGEGDLWRHSLACGKAAQILADTTGRANSGEAFVVGLLHDAGKIILDPYLQKTKQALTAFAKQEDCGLIEAERAVLGYDHAEISGRIMRHWNLPLPLVQAITWHHRPLQEGNISPLAGIAHIADALCLVAGIGLGQDGMRQAIYTQAFQTLRLEERQVDETLSRLVDSIALDQALFEWQSA